MAEIFENTFYYYLSLGYTEGAARYYAELECERQSQGVIL